MLQSHFVKFKSTKVLWFIHQKCFNKLLKTFRDFCLPSPSEFLCFVKF